MRKLSLALMGILVFGLSTVVSAQEKIVVAGTGDSQVLLRRLAAFFEKANPGEKVEVPDTIGSSGGIKALAEGRCDLARVSRPLRLKEKIYNFSYKVIAHCPVVFAVNSGVKDVDNLTSEQIIGIFSGQITSWDHVGGKKEKIYVVLREEGDSALEVLKNNLAGWNSIQFFAGEIVYNTPEAADVIENYKNTIGFMSLSTTAARNMKVIKLDGVAPSIENVKNNSYKLLTQLGIVYKEGLKGTAKKFLDFLVSPAAQKIIIEYGCVPVEEK